MRRERVLGEYPREEPLVQSKHAKLKALKSTAGSKNKGEIIDDMLDQLKRTWAFVALAN